MLTEEESQGLEELGVRRVTLPTLSLWLGIYFNSQALRLFAWKEAMPISLHPGPSIPGWLVAESQLRILAL